MAQVTTLTVAEIRQKNASLLQSLHLLKNKAILVVGDVGLDEYLWGEVRRISPEAPVPVVEVSKQDYRVGLAANVAQNVSSLGGAAMMLAVVGEDATAKDLRQLLIANGTREIDFVVDKDRPTTRKVRVMSGQHHIVRVDYEAKKFVAANIENEILRRFDKVIDSVEGVILQDYGKGVLTESLCQKLIARARQAKKLVAVDPHRTTPVSYYAGADLIKPNRDEAFILSGLKLDDLRLNPNSIYEVADAIRKQTQCKSLVITMGGDGVLIAQESGITRVPTSPRQVFDVTGAGDTFVASLCLAWWSGIDLVTSACLANAAAGVVIGKVGSVPCTLDELKQALQD
jgi:D-glycero-beta-D-manno-heptose-7-phosphate kinase